MGDIELGDENNHFLTRERVVYDGKRLRKRVVRKSVDPGPPTIRYLSERLKQRSARDVPTMNPNRIYARYLLPPVAYISSPITSVTTHFCRTSINKQRCPVNALTWTPEGRRLITGNSSGEFTLWNGLAFNFETILQAHDDAVRAMVWTHNDSWLVTADHGGVIRYWQPSMTNVQKLQGHREAVRSLSFSPTDFKFVSASDDATVKIWNFESGTEERTLTGHGWDVMCVAYHPHKALLASGSKDNLIKLWDPRSGTSLNTLHGHKNHVLKVSWSLNGNWLLSASRDQLLKVYDIRTLKEMYTLRGHAREVTAITWHPFHETMFVSGGFDGSLNFWSLGNETPLSKINFAHDNAIWDMAWHPAGHVLATGSNDHTTKFWCRNRPGDAFEDRYNAEMSEQDYQSFGHDYGVNVAGKGLTYEAAEAEQGIKAAGGSNVPVIPGMGDSASFGEFKYNPGTFATGSSPAPGSQPTKSGRRPPSDTYICKKCGQKGHWIQECPNVPTQTANPSSSAGQSAGQQKVPREGYVCKRCGIPGHFIQDCPESNKPPPTYICHRCGQKGHWKADCPNAPDSAGGNRSGAGAYGPSSGGRPETPQNTEPGSGPPPHGGPGSFGAPGSGPPAPPGGGPARYSAPNAGYGNINNDTPMQNFANQQQSQQYRPPQHSPTSPNPPPAFQQRPPQPLGGIAAGGSPSNGRLPYQQQRPPPPQQNQQPQGGYFGRPDESPYRPGPPQSQPQHQQPWSGSSPGRGAAGPPHRQNDSAASRGPGYGKFVDDSVRRNEPGSTYGQQPQQLLGDDPFGRNRQPSPMLQQYQGSNAHPSPRGGPGPGHPRGPPQYIGQKRPYEAGPAQSSPRRGPTPPIPGHYVHDGGAVPGAPPQSSPHGYGDRRGPPGGPGGRGGLPQQPPQLSDPRRGGGGRGRGRGRGGWNNSEWRQ